MTVIARRTESDPHDRPGRHLRPVPTEGLEQLGLAETPAVSLVIPLYNEQHGLPALFLALTGWSAPFGSCEVIFVDDGSTDRTATIVETRLSRFDLPAKLVRLERNRGKGAAVAAGVAAAEGTFVAFLDADLSVELDELNRALAVMQHHGADVLIGSRAHADTVIPVPQPWRRRLSGRVFNLAVRSLGLSDGRDTQCGFKVFRTDHARRLFDGLVAERFAFDVEVLHRADRLGLEVETIGVEWRHDADSRVRVVTDGLRMFADLLRIRFSRFH